MSHCIDCGEITTGHLKHPVWIGDNLCEDCHQPAWDVWIEDQLDNYKAATGKPYSEASAE